MNRRSCKEKGGDCDNFGEVRLGWVDWEKNIFRN